MTYAVACIGILGFIVWSLLMFTVGLDTSSKAYFTGVTMIIAIRTAIKIFSWLATMFGGKFRDHLSGFYAVSFIFLFTIGGVSGIVLSNSSLDLVLLDTYYVIGLFLYVLSLGAVVSVFCGYYFYSIIILNKRYSLDLSLIQFWLFLIGVNWTFFRMLWLGLNSMRRRYFDYTEAWTRLNKVISLGSFITLVSIGLFFYIIYLQLINGLLSDKRVYLDVLYFFSVNTNNNYENENLELELKLPIYILNYKELPLKSSR